MFHSINVVLSLICSFTHSLFSHHQTSSNPSANTTGLWDPLHSLLSTCVTDRQTAGTTASLVYSHQHHPQHSVTAIPDMIAFNVCLRSVIARPALLGKQSWPAAQMNSCVPECSTTLNDWWFKNNDTPPPKKVYSKHDVRQQNNNVLLETKNNIYQRPLNGLWDLSIN